jgi:site-specific DNA-adenine methylase
MIKTFFSYYGGKYRIAPRYPLPKFNTIIEPFAGSAGYSMRYPHLNIKLYDKYEVVTGIWNYLIKATEEEIRNLPDVKPKEKIDDMNLPQEARWLIGLWIGKGSAYPRHYLTGWALNRPNESSYWNVKIRNRIANQLKFIRHWEVFNKSWEEIDDEQATWFVDPPYQIQGVHYKFNSRQIDYKLLGDWCKNRSGQVIVCENEGADWLPFQPFTKIIGGVKKKSVEVIWNKQ